MKRNRSTDILPRKFEPPGNVKLKLPITGARKYDHITYMPELTWLPVRDQLFFKDMAPDYLCTKLSARFSAFITKTCAGQCSLNIEQQNYRERATQQFQNHC
jgi:hypothetical protein